MNPLLLVGVSVAIVYLVLQRRQAVAARPPHVDAQLARWQSQERLTAGPTPQPSTTGMADRSVLVSVGSGEPEDLAPRNARLTFLPIGDSFEPYPDWIRELRGKSGVYVIRERQRDGSTPVVYVGESHADRLYSTLTRHFQTWRRDKKFWTGQYTGSQSHDPGLTYDRGRCTVAVRVLPAARAIDEEARLIARLRPRDNLIGQPADLAPDEVVPF